MSAGAACMRSDVAIVAGGTPMIFIIAPADTDIYGDYAELAIEAPPKPDLRTRNAQWKRNQRDHKY